MIVGLGIAAILSMFDFVVQIPLLPPPFVWGISAVAALIALPFTFQQARCWRAATRRFDDWESLDLDEPTTA